MPRTEPTRGLLGRVAEREALDRLLDGVRAGRSQVLVLRGEAGAGKTALLDHLLARASGYDVARAAGVESEMELPFSGLHQLCAPMLDRLDTLPGPQRDALCTAFGLSSGPPPDRFLVGLAVLGLLSGAAEERPLLCVVDDAQWQDRASAQTLAFVARRLAADPVGLVFAVREPAENRDLAGLPELPVDGLADGDARALLDSVLPGPLDDRVRERIVAETRGNPLALLELPRGLTPAQLAGGFGVPSVMPLASRIEQSFVQRVEAFPPDTRRLLTLAAAEPIGDVTLLWKAAERLRLGADAAAPAQTAGLIELGARVRFRHPLVRSAAYRAATITDRRAAHLALAEATDPEVDPDRRTWHRANAASGPDEALAGELERSAVRAQARGGVAAGAAFLARATELTADPVLRGVRALDAAQAMFDAAAPDGASELAATAELCPLDPLQRARLQRLRGELAFIRRRGGDAPPLLLAAAQALAPLDPALSRETYLEALGAEIFASHLNGGRELRDAAEAALAAPPAPDPPRAVDVLLDGLATRFTAGYADSVPVLARALDAYAREQRAGEADLRLLWLAWPVANEVWAEEEWEQVAARAVQLARDTGMLAGLPIALLYCASVHVYTGRFARAAALIAEAGSIAEATRTTPLPVTAMVLAAYEGREATATQRIEAGAAEAAARGEGRAIAQSEYARAILCNGLGRYADAEAAARTATENDDLGFLHWALTELVEAAARNDSLGVAAAAFARLDERTSGGGNDWALGIRARSLALMSSGEEADALYREAIARLSRCRIVVHRARAHLVYGEWLRREHRRIDAREHLRTAHEMLAGIGAAAFAERARRELLATGETARQRSLDTRDELTAQEAQIARLARDGHTNPEIGAQLFISPRTVEWHLRHVFTKLDISSRKELRRALQDTASV